MDLAEYLFKREIPQKAFAKTIGIDPQLITIWISGRCMPSLVNAIKIENATKGEVTPRDLYNYCARKNVQRTE